MKKNFILIIYKKNILLIFQKFDINSSLRKNQLS